MDYNSINKELKQKLNFSGCEDEGENGAQQEAPEGREAQSHTLERSEAPDSGAKFTPPRTPLHGVLEATLQEKDASLEPVLRTPVSEPLTCPATPAQPDARQKLLQYESPFTPKVSRLWGDRPWFLQFS